MLNKFCNNITPKKNNKNTKKKYKKEINRWTKKKNAKNELNIWESDDFIFKNKKKHHMKHIFVKWNEIKKKNKIK